MSNTNHPAHTRQFLLITLLVGCAGLLIALAARFRSAATLYKVPIVSSSAVEDRVTPAPEIPIVEIARREISPPNRRPLFAIIFLVLLLLGFFLPHDLSSPLFIALVLGSMGYRLVTLHARIRPTIMAADTVLARLESRVKSSIPTFILAHRLAFSRLLGLLACGIMIVSAIMFLPDHPYENLEESLLVMLVGTAVLSLAFHLSPQPLRWPDLRTDVPISRRFFPYMAMMGVLGLLVLAEISGQGMQLDISVSHHIQFLLLCLSLTLLACGLGGARLRLRAADVWPLPWWKDAVFLTLLTILALGLRFWQLGTAVHYFVDELNFTTAVMNFRYHFNAPLLAPFSSLTAFPWLFPYLQADTVSLFGRDLTGLRAVSAIMGTLTIPALYLLAKTLFDRKTAIIAALLLATFPPHIHFSRIGLNNIADPLFGTFALAFLARGLKTNRRLDFAVGGVMLGLTQYFYEGGRLLYIPLVLLWLVAIFVMRRFPSSAPAESGFSFLRIRRNTGLLTYFVAALLVALPIYYVLVALHEPVTARMTQVGLNGNFWQNMLTASPESSDALAAYLDHIKSSFAVYVYTPDGSLFYGGDQPLLLHWLVPLLLLGVGVALCKLRSPGALLLFLWVILTSLGNSLLTTSTHSTRYVVAYPALMLLVALGIRYALSLILPRKLRYTIIGLLVAAVGVGQVAYYFGPHLKAYNDKARYSEAFYDGQDAAFRSVSFPHGTQIHIISRAQYFANDDATILNFLADGLHMDSISARDLSDDYFDNLPEFRDHAFFVEPGDVDSLQLLEDHFYLLPPQYSPFNVPPGREYVLYYAPYSQQYLHQ